MAEKLGETITKELTIYGQEYVFKIQPYTVVSIDQRSDTHVSGSGGGGNAHRIDPISVSSKVIVTTNFWLKDANGNEMPFQAQADILARNGNKIYGITGFNIRKTNGKEGVVLCVYNATTDQSFWIPPDQFFSVSRIGTILFLFGVFSTFILTIVNMTGNVPLLLWVCPLLMPISFIVGIINLYKEEKVETRIKNFCMKKEWISE